MKAVPQNRPKSSEPEYDRWAYHNKPSIRERKITIAKVRYRRRESLADIGQAVVDGESYDVIAQMCETHRKQEWSREGLGLC